MRRLLHDEHYTIKGVQKLHRDEGIKRITNGVGGSTIDSTPADSAERRASSAGGVNSALTAALADLIKAKTRLDGLLE